MAEGLDMVFESENEQRRPGRCDGAYGQPHETVDALSFNVEKGETLCGTCQAERNGIWPGMIEAVNFGLI